MLPEFCALTILAVLAAIEGVDCSRTSGIDIDYLGYEIYSREYVTDYNISVVPYKNRRVINGTITLAKDLTNFVVDIAFMVPRPKANDIKLLAAKIDGCQLIGQPTTSNLMNIIFNKFRKSRGFFPKKCPIPKARTIFIDHFYVDKESLPSYLLQMTFNGKLDILVNGEYLVKNFVNGTLFSRNS